MEKPYIEKEVIMKTYFKNLWKALIGKWHSGRVNKFVIFCSFGFRKDGGAILTLLVDDKDYTTIELDPKDIESMYSTLQMLKVVYLKKEYNSLGHLLA